ncbi:MAG: DNA methyltransferase, partial [Candidatus Neomarinimicrobiota bacterium]|nr:DNA methyltransferase [Candidatus Neomarinimicrobiota bacterium]
LQTRISWDNQKAKDQPKLPIWKNSVSDIWFATKSSEFMFNQKPVNEIQNSEDLITNFWGDILFLNSPPDTSLPDDKPSKVIERILQASSFKLNWVVDPFARTGGIGKISKRMGRRFIGFETDKDKLILAMKQIDSE